MNTAAFMSPLGMIVCRWSVLLAIGWMAQGLLVNHAPQWRLIVWRSVLVLGLLLPFELVRSHHPIEFSVLTGGVRNSPAATETARSTIEAGGLGRPHLSIWSTTAGAVPDILLTVWALGAAISLLRLVTLQIRLSHLRRVARSAGERTRRIAENLQGYFAFRRLPEIRLSPAACAPFVAGLRRPALFLPEAIVDTLPDEQLTFMLAHEMAHIRAGDLPWSVAWRYLRAIWWFHPLVWAAADMHGLACEQLADERASGYWEDATEYVRFLAHFALSAMPLPRLETALTMNGSAQITRRLKFLQRGSRTLWTKWHSLGGSVVAGLLLFVGAGWGIRANASETADAATSKATADLRSRIGFFEARTTPAPGFVRTIYSSDENGSEPRRHEEELYISKTPGITLDDIEDLAAITNRFKQPELNLRFTPAGRQHFKAMTTALTAGGRKSRVAIIVDGQVKAAPIIAAPIDCDTAIVTGSFDAAWLWSFVQSFPADKHRAQPAAPHSP